MPNTETFVCLQGEWIVARWDAFFVGVWIGNHWFNMASFDAYVYEYTE
jgi:hypothetical protein